tara:strand:+ start:566 stop:1546 length:981 start_codon:yes stop_codon:yes gene_type:complete
MSLGLFKSVILVKDKIKCVAPFKSINFDVLYNHFGTSGNFEYKFQEFIEGTMVNVFHNGEEWELATRSLIGGHGKFYKDTKNTFRKMFIECMNETELEFEHMDKELCYSFVIQHPDNRIVKKVFEPKLYLCNVFKFEGRKVYSIDYKKDNILKKYVMYPKDYDFESVDDAIIYNKERKPTDYESKGIIIEYGPYRSKIENPLYNHVLELRGNQAKPKFNFLRLWKTDKIVEFLIYYPEYNDLFDEYIVELTTFIDNLCKNYVEYVEFYKNPNINENCCDYEFIPHVCALFNIHKNHDIITKQCIIDYVKQLPTERLMFAINFKLRE